MPLAEPGSSARHHAVIYIDSDDDAVTCSALKRKRKRTETPERQDPLVEILMQVLDIVPDVEVAYAQELIRARAITHTRLEEIVERVLEQIFEKDYPKQPKHKGKEKAVEPEDEVDEHGEIKDNGKNYKCLNWRRERRLGRAYLRGALQALEQSFARIPAVFIRTLYYANDNLYTPTFFALLTHSNANRKPYQELQHNRPKPKLKPHAKAEDEDDGAEEFERERSWLDRLLKLKRAIELANHAQAAAHQAALDAGEGFPCGCCFGDETWDNLVQCSEGHLFCKDCAKQYTEGKLGDQITTIVCMDASGCQAPFPESELVRILSTNSLNLYHRLRQAKDLQDAKIDGLENCPYCPYACVIEDADEKLLRCGNEACGIVTCRKCHRPDHIPKTCQELEADSKLDKRHAVEEAMSEALVRNCPKCAKPFIKEEGCNKITCTQCHTISCYICRKVITGYEHFDQRVGTTPGAGMQVKAGAKCLLWDRSRHEEDVATARQVAQTRARAEAEAAGVNLGDNDLNVELPVAAAAVIGIPGVADPRREPAHPGPRHNDGVVGELVPPNPIHARLEALARAARGDAQRRAILAAADLVPRVDEQRHDRIPDEQMAQQLRQIDDEVEIVPDRIAPKRGRNRRR